MNYLLSVLIITYGLVFLLTGISSMFKQNLPFINNAMFLLSGILITISVFFQTHAINLVILIIGLILNQIASILNGIHLYNKIHPLHHVVRLLLNCFIIYMFIILT